MQYQYPRTEKLFYQKHIYYLMYMQYFDNDKETTKIYLMKKLKKIVFSFYFSGTINYHSSKGNIRKKYTKSKSCYTISVLAKIIWLFKRNTIYFQIYLSKILIQNCQRSSFKSFIIHGNHFIRVGLVQFKTII